MRRHPLTGGRLFKDKWLVIVVISPYFFLEQLFVFFLLCLPMASVGQLNVLFWLAASPLWLLAVKQGCIFWIGSTLEQEK
jgi:hypothetical protein